MPPTLFVSPVQRDMPSKPDSFPGLPGILSCPATTHILCGLQKMLYGNKCRYIYVIVKQLCWKYSSMDPCLHLQWVRWDLWAPFLEEGSSHLWGPGAGWGLLVVRDGRKEGARGHLILGSRAGPIYPHSSVSSNLTLPLYQQLCFVCAQSFRPHSDLILAGAEVYLWYLEPTCRSVHHPSCVCVWPFFATTCVCDCVTHTVRPFFALFTFGLDWPPSTVELPRSIWGDWGICPQSPELINTNLKETNKWNPWSICDSCMYEACT